jgi:hypothetical protein
MGPIRRGTPTFKIKKNSFPQSPGKETPYMFSNRAAMERNNPSSNPMVTPLMPTGISKRRSPPTKWGKI